MISKSFSFNVVYLKDDGRKGTNNINTFAALKKEYDR